MGPSPPRAGLVLSCSLPIRVTDPAWHWKVVRDTLPEREVRACPPPDSRVQDAGGLTLDRQDPAPPTPEPSPWFHPILPTSVPSPTGKISFE